MSRADQAFARLVAANPWPETLELPDGLDVLAPRIEEETMAVHELERKQEEKRRWGVPAIAVAAFILVLGAGIALALLVDQSEPQPAAPLEIAADFFEARTNWDGEAVEALVDPRADLDGEFFTSPTGYPRLAAFDAATGTVYRVGDCTEAAIAGSTVRVRVSCTYSFENDWSRALGVEIPEMGNVFTFEIIEGKIHYVEARVSQGFLDGVWNSFLTWLEEAHPDDLGTMFIGTPRAAWPGNRPSLTPESLALWEMYTDEFVEYVNTR